MSETQRFKSLAKLSGAGLISLVIGLPMVFSRDRQTMLAGAGAACAGVAIFVLIFVAAILRTRRPPIASAKSAADASEKAGIVWTGIVLTLIPIPIYYYLKTAMPLFEPEKALVPCLIVLGAGVLCVGIGLFAPKAKN